MTDYIKRTDAVKIAEKYGLANGSVLGRHTGLADCIARDISGLPAADVAEVVHAKWENGNPICPVCGENKFKDLDADIWCDWQPDFCPNCGAKMDGGKRK
nr:MAG TPA: 50S ribosomal subunit [Caudoviricetes sp.]